MIGSVAAWEEAMKPVLHNYFRSSTSYRVRIALALKDVDYDYVAHHLRHGEHRAPEFLAINPQGLVPTLVWPDGTVISQSLAIMEFLDETMPEPRLLPADPRGRARVRSLSQMICLRDPPGEQSANPQRPAIALRRRRHGDRRLVPALGERNLRTA